MADMMTPRRVVRASASKQIGAFVILYLDTNIVIYTVEHHPTFGPKVRNRLGLARAAGDTLMVSDLTRMECFALKSGKNAGINEFALEVQMKGRTNGN
jgi:hypothetical protein